MTHKEKALEFYYQNFVKEHFDVEMERAEIIWSYSGQNNQCIGKRCPFSKVNHRDQGE